MELILLLIALFLFARAGPSGGSGNGSPGGGSPGNGSGGSSPAFRPGRIENRNGVNITNRFLADERAWAPDVRAVAERAGLPPEIVLSVVAQESDGNPQADGALGEVGLMQLTELAVDDVNNNAARMNIGLGPYTSSFEDMTDPQANLQYGTTFLAMQLRRMDLSMTDALRAYNCGETRARQNPGCGSTYADDVLTRAGRGERVT